MACLISSRSEQKIAGPHMKNRKRKTQHTRHSHTNQPHRRHGHRGFTRPDPFRTPVPTILRQTVLEEPLFQLQLEALLSLLGAPHGVVGEVEPPQAERPRVVPLPLAGALDVFEQALAEVVAEELVERACRRVRDVVKEEDAPDDEEPRPSTEPEGTRKWGLGATVMASSVPGMWRCPALPRLLGGREAGTRRLAVTPRCSGSRCRRASQWPKSRHRPSASSCGAA